jgi:hypothetical protein
MTDRDKWLALASRCEAAKGPYREIDAAMHDALFPADVNGVRASRHLSSNMVGSWVPSVSSSLDAITEACRRELPGRDVHSGTFRGRANGMIMNADGTAGPWREAATEPLARGAALCRSMAERTTP